MISNDSLSHLESPNPDVKNPPNKCTQSALKEIVNKVNSSEEECEVDKVSVRLVTIV